MSMHCRVRSYMRVDIEKKVLTEGFEFLKSSSFVTSLLPAMMLSRVLGKKITKEFNLNGQIKINIFLNNVFRLIVVGANGN